MKQIQVPPYSDTNQIKRMKKKIGKLNGHSKRKHDDLISKRNLVKKKIKELKGSREPEEYFSLVELEQAFGRAYSSYRINGRSRMDIDTFFDWIRQNLIGMMNREIQDLGSARVQTTLWIRFIKKYADRIIDREGFPFNSRMMEIFQGSDLNEIVNKMFAHMKAQIESSALRNSGLRFNEILFLDVNFYQLNLTRGNSYLPLPDWMVKRKAVINPKNEVDKWFKRSVTAALHHKEIKSHPERVSNIKQYVDNYNWTGIKFPMAINEIDKFEKNNNISISILGIKGQDIYMQRKSKYNDRKKVVILLLIVDGKKRHYTMIKSSTRLLVSCNSKQKCKQHFCMNCLQGFHSEESRDNTSNTVKTMKQ